MAVLVDHAADRCGVEPALDAVQHHLGDRRLPVLGFAARLEIDGLGQTAFFLGHIFRRDQAGIARPLALVRLWMIDCHRRLASPQGGEALGRKPAQRRSRQGRRRREPAWSRRAQRRAALSASSRRPLCRAGCAAGGSRLGGRWSAANSRPPAPRASSPRSWARARSCATKSGPGASPTIGMRIVGGSTRGSSVKNARGGSSAIGAAGPPRSLATAGSPLRARSTCGKARRRSLHVIAPAAVPSSGLRRPDRCPAAGSTGARSSAGAFRPGASLSETESIEAGTPEISRSGSCPAAFVAATTW